jgi:hypothetical protein
MSKLKIPFGINAILIPLGTLLVVIFIIIFAVKIGMAQIRERRIKLNLSQKNESILTVKKNLLESVSADITNQANFAVAGLPSQNSSLLALSQIRSLAGSYGLSLSNIKVSSGGGSGSNLNSAEIIFDAEGSLNSLVFLVASLNNIAPISKVTKANLAFLGDLTRATLSVRTFWSAFPTKIPAVLDPATSLTEPEKKLLQTISGYTMPAFINLVPTNPMLRSNPFGGE